MIIHKLEIAKIQIGRYGIIQYHEILHILAGSEPRNISPKSKNSMVFNT